MTSALARILKISIPATFAALLLCAIAVEVFARSTWDEKKGRPGLFIRSDTRVEKLSANYTGWFAGIPVRINTLGFRDPREYALAKSPNTFRIVVLGDSVTFGHGSIYESTYPFLLEQRLKAWRPAVDWQVWNLGVPGYNTAQELEYLKEVASTFQPDLVVVGFFWNDVFGNTPSRTHGIIERASSSVLGFLSANSYSFHVYKKAYMNLSAKFLPATANGGLSTGAAAEESLLQKVDSIANLAEQRVSQIQPLDDVLSHQTNCMTPRGEFGATGEHLFKKDLIKSANQERELKDAINGFRALQSARNFRLAFFLNMAPDICLTNDLFYKGPNKLMYDYFMEALGAAGPTVSAYDEFYKYRPSQMPLAGGHSLGNSNDVKARVLFDFLTRQQLVAEGASR